jgi:hypothetical protein
VDPTNPLTSIPDSPIKAADIEKADLIVVADGHGDEVDSTVEIAQNTGATVLAPDGVDNWLMEQGSRAHRCSVQTLVPQGTLRRCGADEPSVTWSPDATQLFVYSGTGSFLVDLASSELTPLRYVTEAAPETRVSLHGRPDLVIHADRFAEACERAITDEVVRTLPRLVGCVHKWVDATDVLGRPAILQRPRTIWQRRTPKELRLSDSLITTAIAEMRTRTSD